MILFSKCPKTVYFPKGNSRFSGAFWESKKDFSLSLCLFFFPQLKLRRENLFSQKDIFLFFFFSILEKKNPSSFLKALLWVFLHPPPSSSGVLSNEYIMIRGRLTMALTNLQPTPLLDLVCW